MSNNNSPTKQRRKAVLNRAEEICYKLKGAEYRDNLNPYPLHSFDFNRFKRFYEGQVRSYRLFQSQCDHFAEIYGEFRSENALDLER